MNLSQIKIYGVTIFLTVLFNAPAVAAGNQKAGQTKFETCSGCHSRPGYSNVYPRYNVPKLAGQHAGYTVSALKAYAGSDRAHPGMQGNAAGLSAEDMDDIAAYLATFELTDNQVEVTGNIGAGENKAASCVGCHGEGGNSSDANYPKLAGQYESYLIKVLQDYKSVKRSNPMMNSMVGALSEQDIADIAAFYASQTKGLGVVER